MMARIDSKQHKQMQRGRLYVYVVFDDCPEQFGDKRIIAILANNKTATDFMLKEKGKNVMAGQYLEVQRWRVQ